MLYNITCYILLLVKNEIEIFEQCGFKHIEVKLDPCPVYKRCTLFSCSQVKVINNTVDISKITETRTDCKNGSQIWKIIYKRTRNSYLRSLISGVHFCINIHISYNYYNCLLTGYHNIEKFKGIRKFFPNYVLLFICVREAVLEIIEEYLSDKLITKSKSGLLKNSKRQVYHDDKISLLAKGLLQKIISCNIGEIEKMIKDISCLDCEKCMVIGSVLFKGLKACVSKRRSINDKISLLILYKKILKTIQLIYKLENMR